MQKAAERVFLLVLVVLLILGVCFAAVSFRYSSLRPCCNMLIIIIGMLVAWHSG